MAIFNLTLNPSALARAEKGLRWLQQEGPRHGLDWRRINLDTLDIDSPSRCVLSQASGNMGDGLGYGTVLFDLWRSGVVFNYVSGEWPAQHGFEADDDVSARRLTDAWRHVLAHEHEMVARAAVSMLEA